MAENEDGQDRTERATPKREQEAKKKGQVARSRELNTMSMLLFGSGAMLLLGGGMISRLGRLMSEYLSLDRDRLLDPGSPLIFLQQAVGEGLTVVTPFLLIMAVVAVGSSVALGGWSFSTEAIAFKLDKLNPIKGLKRIFALRGLVELGKALAKFLLIGSLAVILLVSLSNQFLALGYESAESAMGHAAHMLGWAFLALSLTLILIAAVDVPFQLWDHAQQLKMTRQEIKDEHKDTEGKPEVKGRIRNMQREMAQRRMMAAVPKADVVVTNPTHFAIALRYDAANMRAPQVVAKGTDLVAGQIRSIALESNVPIFPAPPLARALYYTTEIDQEIPAGLYLAVAQVLAYLYQLRAARKQGDTPPPAPEVPVPEALYQPHKGYRH